MRKKVGVFFASAHAAMMGLCSIVSTGKILGIAVHIGEKLIGEQFLRQHDICTCSSGLSDQPFNCIKIVVNLRAASMLDGGNLDLHQFTSPMLWIAVFRR